MATEHTPAPLGGARHAGDDDTAGTIFTVKNLLLGC